MIVKGQMRGRWGAISPSFGGENVIPGNIIIRQRGTKWHPGEGVGIGKDHTIFAMREGNVSFATKAKGRVYVSVDPMTTK